MLCKFQKQELALLDGAKGPGPRTWWPYFVDRKPLVGPWVKTSFFVKTSYDSLKRKKKWTFFKLKIDKLNIFITLGTKKYTFLKFRYENNSLKGNAFFALGFVHGFDYFGGALSWYSGLTVSSLFGIQSDCYVWCNWCEAPCWDASWGKRKETRKWVFVFTFCSSKFMVVSINY